MGLNDFQIISHVQCLVMVEGDEEGRFFSFSVYLLELIAPSLPHKSPHPKQIQAPMVTSVGETLTAHAQNYIGKTYKRKIKMTD